jgi:hypothetical protein
MQTHYIRVKPTRQDRFIPGYALRNPHQRTKPGWILPYRILKPHCARKQLDDPQPKLLQSASELAQRVQGQLGWWLSRTRRVQAEGLAESVPVFVIATFVTQRPVLRKIRLFFVPRKVKKSERVWLGRTSELGRDRMVGDLEKPELEGVEDSSGGVLITGERDYGWTRGGRWAASGEGESGWGEAVEEPRERVGSVWRGQEVGGLSWRCGWRGCGGAVHVW